MKNQANSGESSKLELISKFTTSKTIYLSSIKKSDS